MKKLNHRSDQPQNVLKIGTDSHMIVCKVNIEGKKILPNEYGSKWHIYISNRKLHSVHVAIETIKL